MWLGSSPSLTSSRGIRRRSHHQLCEHKGGEGIRAIPEYPTQGRRLGDGINIPFCLSDGIKIPLMLAWVTDGVKIPFCLGDGIKIPLMLAWVTALKYHSSVREGFFD